MPTFVFIFSLLVHILLTQTAEAVTQQNVVISDGFLRGDTVTDFGVAFSLSGDNLSASQAFNGGPRLFFNRGGIAVVGSQFDLGGRVFTDGFLGSPSVREPVIMVNGTLFQPPTADFSLDWRFSSMTSSLPSTCKSGQFDSGCNFPFNFNGTLEIRQNGTPIYDLTLTGNGLAFPSFHGGLGTPRDPLLLTGMTYQFVPVPEPATILLLLIPTSILLIRRMIQRYRHG